MQTYWDVAVGKNLDWGDPIDHPSRKWLVEQAEGSVLEMGFGTGKDYRNLRGRVSEYRGYDNCMSFVELCKELFPEGDFRFGDALNIPERVCSWDTVILRHVVEHTRDWKAALFEAFRVARRKVLLVLWRPLGDKPSSVRRREPEGYCWDINREEFLDYLRSLTPDIRSYTLEGERPNWAWVLEKNDVVFDLDDFHEHAPNIYLLSALEERFPELKVTLFTVPAKCSLEFLRKWANRDWVELAVHGWTHEPNTECLKWCEARTRSVLEAAELLDAFVKGFRAPGWELRPEVARVLAKRGYWLSHLRKKQAQLGDTQLPVFWLPHPWSVHGHMQNISSNRPQLQNGLAQLLERGYPFHEGTRFHYISELVQ